MTSNFAEVLRRLRLESGLSQESLAELSGVSAVAISGYERRLRAVPRRETVSALAEALQLTGESQVEFERSARGKRHPAQAPAERNHNLPWQATSFIGRQRELSDITKLLAPRSLVTVTGPGGIGKTRIVLEVASRLVRPPGDGMWLVDLALLTDRALVLGKIAAVFGLDPREQGDPLRQLISAIKTRELILIVDNCEHLLPAVRTIVEAMLQECLSVSVLATSRERLGVPGERAYPLSTLPIPDATALFAMRAEMAKPGFIFSDVHAEAATDICRRLDGIALAIELAAARLPVLGLSEIRRQLSTHFRVVASKTLGLPPRQQTLDAMISWSYGLLNETERVLFRRLAIFAGGWSMETAEAVCADEVLPVESVLDTLVNLVEKSLVNTNGDDIAPRYSFFESTRAYALEQLSASAEGPTLSRRHAQWMAILADRAYETFLIELRRNWEISLVPELDNALAALEWAVGSEGDIVLAGRIASGFQGLWITAPLRAYGLRYVNAAVVQIDEYEHPTLAPRLMAAQSLFLHGTARVDVQKRAIALLEHVDDRRMLARSYSLLAYSLSQTGHYADAVEASNAAADLIHQEHLLQSPLYLGLLGVRSRIFRRQGRFDEAKSTLAEALLIAEALKDDWSLQRFHALLADIEFAAGDAQRAVAVAQEALASHHRIRGSYNDIYLLCNLSCYQLVLGTIDAAEANAREVLQLARTSNEFIVHTTIQHLATVAALRGRASSASRLLGCVNAWYERISYHRDPTDQKGYEALMASLRAQLSDDEISELAAQGSRLSTDAAIEHALTI